MTQVDPAAEPDAPVGIDPAEFARVNLENAMHRAGVDLESPQGKLMQQAWANTAPDVEAIKVQWDLVKPAPLVVEPIPDPEPTLITGEAGQAAERRGLAASSVVEPNPTDVDPNVAAVQAGIEVLVPPAGKQAGTRDNAQATVVHTLLDAAANGDARVLVSNEPAGASE